MKGNGREIIINPIEATMQSALATFVRSCITPRRHNILASINLDMSGFADSRYTRVMQDINTPCFLRLTIFIITKKSLDYNIQGV